MISSLVLILLVFLVYILSYSISFMSNVDETTKISNKYIKEIIKNRGNYLTRAELSITLLEFIVSTLVVDTYARPILELFNINTYLAKYVIIITTTIIFAYIVTIFGKYMPKYIAIRDKSSINKYIMYLAIIISDLFLPFTIFSNYIYNKLIKKLDKEKVNELNSEDIKRAANISYGKKVLNKTERDIILNSVNIKNLKAKDIVKDINDCIYLEKEDTIDKLLKLYKKYNYTRFPVVNIKKGNIIGIVSITDIFNDLNNIKDRKVKLTKYIKEPLYLSINCKLTTIYNRMKTNDSHISVMYDNNDTENTVGIITVEDIIEEII